jgi:hypothetical protein
MTRPATYEDANLILRLYEIRREPRMRDARRWFSQQFKAKTLAEWQQACAPGTDSNDYYRMVTTYWEMACSFVTGGVLHPDLFCQNCMEALMVWTKVSPFVNDVRALHKNPGHLKNLEAAAPMFKKYLEQHGPESYEAFQNRWKS